MFMGPLEVSKPWSKQGVEGARRFIGRVWTFFTNPENLKDDKKANLEKLYHKTVKKVTDDFESLGFNTAISQMLSCITPHVGEEMWSIFGHEGTIAYEPWPVYDENLVKDDEIEIGVQVNGKVKDTVLVGVDEDNDSAIAKAKASEAVKRAIEGKTIVKEIYVKGRIINIVVK